MAEIEVSRHEVAGIPVFVLEGGSPVPTLGVTFRVGRVDETATTSGITHLVEHLVLPARTDVSVDFNGVVDTLYTSMYAAGEPDELLEFLASIVALLRQPPVDRIEIERRTLLAEEVTRSTGGARQAFALRYGPHGAGLTGYDEYGLRRIGVSDVDAWATKRFTRESAAIWLSGVPLDQLDVGLASGGSRIAAPEPRQIDDLQTPAVYAYGSGTGTCLSLIARRSPTTNLALDALADGLRQRLRYELGLSYSIDTDTQPLTGSLTQLILTADVADDDAARWLEEAVAILDVLAADGPTPAWLERAKSGWRRYDRDPRARTGWAASRADFELVGRPFQTNAAHLAEREAVTGDDIAHYLAAARESLLVLGSSTTPVPPGFEEYPVHSTVRVVGRRRRPRGVRNRLRRDYRDVALISGDEGVTFVTLTGLAYTALYDSAVVCLRRPGERTLLSDDGFFVEVVANDWTDGRAALEEIDARVAPERAIDMARGIEGRIAEVERISSATFRRTWLVSEELAALPELLDDDETLLVLAQASRGWRLGLVALTDRRLHFLYGRGQTHSFAADRGTVQVHRTRGSKLELDCAGELVALTDIGPKGKAAELADALETWA